jgi:uncharacterized protein (TIGR02611 family)
MIQRAKENWRRLKESRPGRRFQDHHYRHQHQDGRGRSSFQVIFNVVGGVMVVGGGLVAVPGPGPGWLIILLGLVMIAGESLSFARFADRAEIKLRRLARRVAAVWAASPASAKVLMMLALTFCAIASGYGIYRLIFGS